MMLLQRIASSGEFSAPLDEGESNIGNEIHLLPFNSDRWICIGYFVDSEGKGYLFKTSYKNKQYGPGHNSFTVSEDGMKDLLVYHARNYTDIEGDPLYDPNRHTRVQVIEWDKDGFPIFGEPVMDTRNVDFDSLRKK